MEDNRLGVNTPYYDANHLYRDTLLGRSFSEDLIKKGINPKDIQSVEKEYGLMYGIPPEKLPHILFESPKDLRELVNEDGGVLGGSVFSHHLRREPPLIPNEDPNGFLVLPQDSLYGAQERRLPTLLHEMSHFAHHGASQLPLLPTDPRSPYPFDETHGPQGVLPLNGGPLDTIDLFDTPWNFKKQDQY